MYFFFIFSKLITIEQLNKSQIQWVFYLLLSAPVITRPPKNATVLLQRRYALPCESSGNPKPKITWFFNGNTLNSRGSNYRISSQSGSLRFSRVNVNNGGFYQCQARNKLGKVTSEVITFTVHGKFFQLIFKWRFFVWITLGKKSHQA